MRIFGTISFFLGLPLLVIGGLTAMGQPEQTFDCSTFRQLTHNDIDDTDPQWSPDGQWIAFTRDERIHLMRPDGSESHQIMQNGGRSIDPAWSPDGKWLLFASDRGGDFEIYRMRINNTQAQQLTYNDFEDTQPSLSSDEQVLVFVSTRGVDNYYDLYRMPLDGQDGSIFMTGFWSVSKPVWSPIQRQIIFQAPDSHRGMDLYFGPGRGLNSFTYIKTNVDPTWSPDGQWIIFAGSIGYPGSPTNLYRSRSSSNSVIIELTNTEWTDKEPTLSPDGKWIIFSSDRDGDFELYCMPSGLPQNARSAAAENVYAIGKDYSTSILIISVSLFLIGVSVTIHLIHRGVAT